MIVLVGVLPFGNGRECNFHANLITNPIAKGHRFIPGEAVHRALLVEARRVRPGVKRRVAAQRRHEIAGARDQLRVPRGVPPAPNDPRVGAGAMDQPAGSVAKT